MRGIYLFLGYFLICMFFLPLVNGVVGVSPSRYEIDFQPGLKRVFTFQFFNDENSRLQISVEGDLANYTELSKKVVEGTGYVNVLLDLPESIDRPGIHTLYVGGKQIIEEETGFGIVGNIRAIIIIRVPYPGKYIEIDEFEVSNANAEEPVSIKLSFTSRGKDSVAISTNILIFDSKANQVDTLNLGGNILEPTESVTFDKIWETKGEDPGFYKALAVVDYIASRAEREASFRLGELFINITGYTRELSRDKINKFDINVESFWKEPIRGVYANVSIIGYDINFLTPSVNVEGFGTATLSGYFDTTPIKEDSFKARIILSYEGKTTEVVVPVRFTRQVNYVMVGLVALVIIIFIALVIISYVLIKVNKKKR